MSRIAIILLNYNSTSFTKNCIQSLWETKATQDEYDIVVFDNASDNPPAKETLGDCDLVLSKKNIGYAQGNNKAVEHVLKKGKPDYILILNNDTRMQNACVRTLIGRFESEKNAGFVVPKIYFEKGREYHRHSYTKDEKGRVLWYAGGGIDWRNLIVFHKGMDEVDRGQFEHSAKASFASGCAFLTTPAIWKKLGGFDVSYFLYYEDADLSMRLHRIKKDIVFEPGSVVYHINAGSTQGSGSTFHQYYQTRNRLKFGLQYAPWRTKVALLREAKRIWNDGNASQKKAVMHALAGKWGKQNV